ncbi:pyridoxal phosphate-dependent aminotransferase [Lutispora thermophila]|uniref:L-threonine O-3-phosphate decarboxylase n=1 Tax=Lutispora thermophila DSM 19022 TaxID=1122184 RepID=A0A1M6CFS6_9FIRM|nr:histidinol-phosphate transaminase [Lutispora thermophila]SHI59773.1 L-threonine O-3-phosphate decarboxylase [Lutispora thermophila DSM 19022]
MSFHGGNIYDYNNIIYDFSANINPAGVPESFKKALRDNMDVFARYPDTEYRALVRSIKDYLSLDDDAYVLPGNGAVDLIYSILDSMDYNKLFTMGPTFSEYRKAAIKYNIRYEEVFCYNHDFSKIDIELFLNIVEERSIIILCNPNNPTGFLIDIATLAYIAAQLNEKNSILIIDEAFIEFTDDYPHSSFLSKMYDFGNVVLIRAATKFFGMPGIRLGYAITCNRAIWERIKKIQQPWSVNAAAVIAGSCIFGDKDYISKSHEWIKEERLYLYNELSNLKGLEVYSSKANFHLLKITEKSMDAYKLRNELVKHGILIRTPDGFSYLTSNHFRLAVLDRKANSFLLSVLYEVLL